MVTDTAALPTGRAGVCAWMLVEETTLNEAATPPTVTDVAPVKPVPVMVIDVPPAVGPALGLTPVMVGGARYVYAEVLVAVPPPGVVTATFTVPAEPVGVYATICVDELTV